MDLCEKFREHITVPGAETGGGLLKGAGQQSRDFIDRDPAGKFARRGTAHSITHGENEISAAE
jgi:hypothetical protein